MNPVAFALTLAFNPKGATVAAISAIGNIFFVCGGA